MDNKGIVALAFAGFLALIGAIALAGYSARAELAEARPAVEPAKLAAKAPPAAVPAPDAPVNAPAVEAGKDDPFVIKRILPIKGPMKYGSWHWDDANVPNGPIVITVDLDARVLSIFKAGYEIGAAVVLLGTDDHETPLGVFPITQKKRHHVSNLYDAPMPYMQRLTDDGITLHATKVEWGYASHGCIGMPEPFAAKVFASTKLGDKVYITRGKMIGLGDKLAAS